MKLRSPLLLVTCLLCAASAIGCAASADGSSADEKKAPASHVWPTKDAGAHDAGKVTEDAGPPWSAFESPDGGATTGGTGGGTGGTGGTSGGSGLDACGICDRAWQCDAALDAWASEGASACVDSRTGTSLNCDGSMQGGGTWSGDSSEIVLAFPNLGGGSVDVYCTPP